MRVYRLAYRDYILDVTGTGAQLYGGRWNPKGIPCIYTSEYLSLALLEKFVHARGAESVSGLMLLQIEIPDGKGLVYHTDAAQMATDWTGNVDYSQWIGEQILREMAIVAFSVPSVIVPSERNFIINPQATHFGDVLFFEPTPFEMDVRLLDRLG